MRSSQTEAFEKSQLRRLLINKRGSISSEEKARLDSALCAELIRLANKADVWLLFYPIKNEPDLLAFAEYLLSVGKQVAFPISLTDTCRLDFRLVDSLSQMKAGAYGIPEPPECCRKVEIFDGAMCIVPALSYDTRGFRIGYGKGYYDRFLSRYKPTTVGICYGSLICDRLPTDPTDIPVDMIITESGVTVPNAAKEGARNTSAQESKATQG